MRYIINQCIRLWNAIPTIYNAVGYSFNMQGIGVIFGEGAGELALQKCRLNGFALFQKFYTASLYRHSHAIPTLPLRHYPSYYTPYIRHSQRNLYELFPIMIDLWRPYYALPKLPTRYPQSVNKRRHYAILSPLCLSYVRQYYVKYRT